ncbi:MAG: LamG-like jellyroll fold domain-containing protein [Candidatus Taylorbacteria bacterium]
MYKKHILGIIATAFLLLVAVLSFSTLNKQINNVYTSSQRAQAIPSSNLISYWAFDGNANDSVGSNTGTLINGPTFTTGKIGQGLKFDGVDDYVDAKDINALDGLNAMTVSVWIKQVSNNEVGQLKYLVTKGSPYATIEWSLYSDNYAFNPQFQITSGGVKYSSGAAPTITDSNWHHLVGMYDGSKVSIWVDGVKKSEAAASGTTDANSKSVIINNIFGPNWVFNGSIDEVRIYSRALSAQEITDIYNSTGGGVTPTPPPPTSVGKLISYWAFDGNANDSVGSNTGTLINGPTFTTGKIGQGLKFDGVDDYVDAKDINALDGLNAMTVSVWIKQVSNNEVGQLKYLVTKGSPYATIEWSLYSDNYAFNPQFQITSGGVKYSSGAAPTITDSNWHHLVGMYDGSKVSIWVDGVKKSEAAASGTTDANSKSVIINNIFGPNWVFNGSIDEVRIYSRALSAQEITELLNAVGGGGGTAVNGLCSTTLNQCTSGTFADVTDTSTARLWSCTGSNGGTTASCSETISVVPDTTAPSTPTNLSASAVSSSQINLSWTASTDNVGVTGYKVFRNGTQVATPSTNSYSSTGLTANTSYSYTVLAQDAAGNPSAQSSSASATTQAVSAGNPRTYVTTFSGGAENPLSESGNWINGKATGLDWTDMRMANGLVYGTQPPSGGYDDSTAILSGTWGPDQTVTAVVHTVNPTGSAVEELEIRLRSSISAHSNTGYELTYGLSPTGTQYYSIVRWNGALGNFTVLANLSAAQGAPFLTDNSTIKGTMIGNTITLYVNNVSILTTTDSTFASGAPGIGWLRAYGGADTDYGFRSVTATDGSGSGSPSDTQAPSVPTNLSSSNVTQTGATISWTASTDTGGGNVAGYKVWRGGAQVGTVTSGTSFANSGLVASTTYSYTISSYDNAGAPNNSVPSAALSVTTSGVATPTTFTLTITKAGTGGGTVTSTGGSVSCGSTCSASGLTSGTVSTLTAVATSGSTFTGWSGGGCSGTGTCVVTVASNTTVTATFNLSSVSGVPAPTYVSAAGVAPDQISLIWLRSTPTTGTITSYTIYRNGTQIGTIAHIPYQAPYHDTEQQYYQDFTVSPGTTYTYTVTATDNGGNVSPPSAGVAATTPGGSSALIPSNRLANWIPGVTAGVTGGIPTNRTHLIDVTQAPYNADKTGATDAAPAINSAITAAVANDIVYLPAGTYKILTQIVASFKSNITLRGAGASTILDCYVPSVCVNIRGSEFYNVSAVPVLSGASKGSTQVSVSDSSPYTVGNIVKISGKNKTSLPTISVSGYENIQSQIVVLTGKSGSALSFSPPLIVDFSGRQPSITAPNYATSRYVGIEDLTIDGSNATTQFGISAGGTYASWVKNVKVRHMSNYSISFNDSLGCEVRHSFLDELNHGGTNGSGFLSGGNTGCLFEDNIVYKSFPLLEINFSSVGNVFAYNYMPDGSVNVNHGSHNSYNLYEGNYLQGGEFKSDGYFGSDSEEMFFRNWTSGFLAFKRFSRNFSAIGNVVGAYSLGQPNIGNGASTGFALPSQGIYWLDWSPVAGLGIKGTLTSRASDGSSGVVTLSAGTSRLLGYCQAFGGNCPAITTQWSNGARIGMHTTAFSGNAVSLTGGYLDPLPAQGTAIGLWPRSEGFQELDMDVGLTFIRKQNYIFGKGIPANEALTGGQTLPNSLYLSSKPAWFGSLSWPPYSPTNAAQTADNIPAGYRFNHPGQEAPGVSVSIKTNTDSVSPVNVTAGVLKALSASFMGILQEFWNTLYKILRWIIEMLQNLL